MTTEQKAAHTDHPLRHFDRTCPACIAEGEQKAAPSYDEATIGARNHASAAPDSGAQEDEDLIEALRRDLMETNCPPHTVRKMCDHLRAYALALREKREGLLKAAEAMAATGASATHIVELIRSAAPQEIAND
jgi:hypothetical protein